MRRAPRVLAVGLALSLCAVPPAGAQMPGRIEVGLPAQSASQASTPLESTFQERLVSPGRLRAMGALEKSLEGLPAFLRDTNLTLKPRTYYFDESDPNGETKEAWVLGGSLEGLWFRLQRNWEWDAGGGQINQWRAIVYWEVPLI